MYYDVKKELDVARIEHLMKEISPASNAESSAKQSINTSLANKTEMRRLLESMKKNGSKFDDKDNG